MTGFCLDDLSLRPMDAADLERVLAWRNDPRVRDNMYTNHVITLDEHYAWFQRVSGSATDQYFIFTLGRRDVGVVAFNGINREHSRAFWAFYLGETDVPRGTGSAMEYLALEHAFGVLELNKLACEVIDFNEAVVRMHKRFGFVEEGRFADEVLRDGDYRAVVRLAHFRQRWEAQRDEMRQRIFGGACS